MGNGWVKLCSRCDELELELSRLSQLPSYSRMTDWDGESLACEERLEVSINFTSTEDAPESSASRMDMSAMSTEYSQKSCNFQQKSRSSSSRNSNEQKR